MAYLSKQTILEAYKILSSNTNDPLTQGATQAISAIRYLLALDRFYIKNSKPCDTKNKLDKDLYTSYVGEVVSINDNIYTSNFHLDIKSDLDYKVGSNFYSVNVVKDSLVNPALKLDFPRRSKNGELFHVQNGVLSLDNKLIKNIQKYIPLLKCKIALCLWLCRNDIFESEVDFTTIRNILLKRYSDNIVNILLHNEYDYKEYISNYKVTTDTHKPLLKEEDIKELFNKEINFNESKEEINYLEYSLQKIFYGAPGTGKSYCIKQKLQGVNKEYIIRTTFHPDSDYATFVGSYKPTMKSPSNKVNSRSYTLDELAELLKIAYESAEKKSVATDIFGITYAEHIRGEFGKVSIKELIEKAGLPEGYNVSLNDSVNLYHDYLKKQKSTKEEIVYTFTPQAFINAYIKAYNSPEEKVYLIIEEINRGNCAQIFGDLFQLLDRNEDGVSEYPIKADADLCAFLKKELGADSDGIVGGELCLPSNLYIWATMNTSDQSLFPIDSAFKRRWDWEYIPIQYCNNDWNIKIGNLTYKWTEFQKAINKKIQNATNSEDKKIGDYFVNVKNRGGIISQDLLLNKIIFYLWNDVCKDDEGEIFRVKIGTDETDVTFSEFFDEANKIQKLQGWMNFLGVNPIETKEQGFIDDDAIDEPSKYQYSINDEEPFQKTYLGFKTFQKYVELHPEEEIEEVLKQWKTLKNVPKHLIETEASYTDFLNSSKGDRKKNESRFEMATFKGQKFYLWKGWGDGAQDNITAYMDAVNNADWGIVIKRIG